MNTRSAAHCIAFALVALGASGCDTAQDEPPVPLDLVLDGVDVLETQSGDRLVQSGEYVELDAFLTNRSALPIDSVGFRVESDEFDLGAGGVSAYINGEVVYIMGDIDDRATLGPGESVRINVRFRVPPNTPTGTVGTLAFRLTGRGDRSGRVTADITTAALPYEPAVVGTAVATDTNGNGRVEPGESAEIEVSVGAGPNGTVCFGFGVTSALSQITVYGLADAGSGCASLLSPGPAYRFGLRAASFVPSGTVVPLTLSARDRFGNTWALPFSVTLG